MSDLILCGPCGYADNNKESEKWCTVCEEGLCADCETVHKSIKTSRDHRLISTEDFQQIKNVSVSLNCEDHCKRLELFCKTHDVAVCVGCVPSYHRTCSDVIPLDKAAENVKHSTALADLEDNINGTLQNIQHIITDRDSELKSFDDQKLTIKTTINDTRVRITKKLDDLEQKLLLELDTQWGNCNSEATKLLNRLKKSGRDLSCLKEKTSQLKSFASDIQLFLGTRQINEAVFKEVETVKEEIKSVFNYALNLQFQPSVMSLIQEMDQLGKISVKETTINLQFKDAKVDQAQIQLAVHEKKSINNIHVKLKKRFNVKQKGRKMWLSGCTILLNGNLLIADYLGHSVLMEYSENDKHIRDIPCSSQPFDLTVIDTDRIAVTYGIKNYIEISNIKNNTVDNKFKFDASCYGISYQDKKLFLITTEDVIVLDIAGNILKTLEINSGLYLEATIDRLHFAILTNLTVHCISMTEEHIWVHKKESLGDPSGITVDDHKNVFVNDELSNSLIVIQHDGKSSKTLLSETDGLNKPTALHYSKDKKTLLLCNRQGNFAIYNVE